MNPNSVASQIDGGGRAALIALCLLHSSFMLAEKKPRGNNRVIFVLKLFSFFFGFREYVG